MSLEDACCIYHAENLPAVCITNDVALRKVCEQKGLRVVWGLEMILFLAQEKKITKSRAKDIGIKIHEINPVISDEILAGFVKKLGEL